jgi:prepilin-type N-terminal cleavage/methylation domain-containing protein
MAKVQSLRKSEDGFTLLELIVVVALLSVLAGMAVPLYGNVAKSAERNLRVSAASTAATEIAVSILSGGTAAAKVKELNDRGATKFVYSVVPPADSGYTEADLATLGANTTSDRVFVVVRKIGDSTNWTIGGNLVPRKDSFK